MKYISLTLILLCLVFNAYSQTFSQIEYQGSDDNFANPERGFYHYVSDVEYDQLVSFREEEAITLIYKNYRLDDYTETEIPLWFLQNMEKDFDIMRKAGIKCVLRYNYTFSMNKPYGDARPEIVLKHVAQLKPYLQANSDVIYVLQAGFIGAWGEWYYTDYYQDWDDRRELMDALLDAMPASRQVQLRTPNYKQKILESNDYVPISESEAFTNTLIARTSHHNDCFVAGNNDFGTYQDTAVEKPYLADDTKYALMGGETCNECTCASCENSLLELRRFHWSYINIDYHTAVLQGWKDEGCYPEVERKLGFRFRMLNAIIQDETKPGGMFNINLKVLNDGWANPGNPRNVELIIRNLETKEEFYLPINEDPRNWPMDDTIVISIESGIPVNVNEGNYGVYLNLPDPEATLADVPAFSIRTANTDTWEDTTGYNFLQKTISIKNDVNIPAYIGGNIMKQKNATAIEGINIIIDGQTEDWNELEPVYTDQTQPAKTLTTYNTADSLFFVVKGESLHPDIQLFIDADMDTETGYAAWQWSINGSDYFMENEFLYKYSGTNHEWGWEQIGNATISKNENAIEFGFRIEDLNDILLSSTYSIGLVNDPKETGEASYIPKQNDPFLVLKQLSIFGRPEAIGATGYSNNNIVYWANSNASTEVYNVLERSDDGVNFEQIEVSENSAVSYTDKNLEENKEYTYRIRYKDGNITSDWQEPIAITTSSNEKVFVQINLDGNADDWNIVAPSGTGFDEEFLELRLTSNVNDLFYSLKAKTIQDYKIYFDTDSDNQFDYCINNDSLLKYSEGWLFEKKLESYSSDGFLEASAKLEDLNIEGEDYFLVAASFNAVPIPGNNFAFAYLKPPVIPIAEYFRAEPSAGDYYGSIVLKWKPSENTEGYIVERSIGDSLNFEAIIDLPKNSTFYIDNELDSSFTYYYRMFSYNDIYRSVYTTVSDMKPGTGVGINDGANMSNGSIIVSPNPFRSTMRIDIDVKQPESITVELYDSMTRKVATLYSGKVYSKKIIEYQRDHLKDGLYFLKVFGSSTSITNKIIAY